MTPSAARLSHVNLSGVSGNPVHSQLLDADEENAMAISIWRAGRISC